MSNEYRDMLLEQLYEEGLDKGMSDEEAHEYACQRAEQMGYHESNYTYLWSLTKMAAKTAYRSLLRRKNGMSLLSPTKTLEGMSKLTKKLVTSPRLKKE